MPHGFCCIPPIAVMVCCEATSVAPMGAAEPPPLVAVLTAQVPQSVVFTKNSDAS